MKRGKHRRRRVTWDDLERQAAADMARNKRLIESGEAYRSQAPSGYRLRPARRDTPR